MSQPGHSRLLASLQLSSPQKKLVHLYSYFKLSTLKTQLALFSCLPALPPPPPWEEFCIAKLLRGAVLEARYCLGSHCGFAWPGGSLRLSALVGDTRSIIVGIVGRPCSEFCGQNSPLRSPVDFFLFPCSSIHSKSPLPSIPSSLRSVVFCLLAFGLCSSLLGHDNSC